MRATTPRLTLPVLFLVAGAAVATVVGCSAETDPTLNPQPLPPQTPPEDGVDQVKEPGAFGGRVSETEDGRPSSGSSGTPAPNADAGGGE